MRSWNADVWLDTSSWMGEFTTWTDSRDESLFADLASLDRVVNSMHLSDSATFKWQQNQLLKI